MSKWKIEGGAKHGVEIKLLTPAQLKNIPDGAILYDIFGVPCTKGTDYIDDDTRGGYLAYGTIQD